MGWSAVGAIALCLAVAFGAFGAHGLRGKLDAYSIDIYERAVFYQFIHAIGLLVTPLFVKSGMLRESTSSLVCLLLLAGILLFSGSLYALALSGNRILGAITPFGGLSFLAAWLLLAWALFRAKP